MSETTKLLPAPDAPEPRPGPLPPPVAAGGTDLLPWLCGAGFVVLAIAILVAWLNPNAPTETLASIHAMDQRLDDLDGRMTRMEQRPTAASATDLAKLAARLDAVESRAGDPAQLGVRLDALSGRIEALAGRSQSGLDAEKQQLDALTTRLTGLEKAAATVNSLPDRLTRVARLQEAGLALAAGKPVGDVPNAPEALARFAHAAPPTEAQLRLSFPQAEAAAMAADQPGDEKAPFIGRIWDRAQGLVTVKRSGDVVLGNPSSVPLANAKAALDAGDLASAVAAVKTLTGPPLQAMNPWLGQATALLAARAALADMAGQA
jgi:hypothetical protein